MNELTDGQIDALLVLHGKGDDGFHSFARGAIAADRALQASRVAELEAQLESVGAGGVGAMIPKTIPDRTALIDLIAEHLSGTYHCTRVWSAWRVGTMSQDDFADVSESDTPSEITEAIIATLISQQIAEPAAATGWKWVPLEPTAKMLQAGQDTPVSESDEDALEDYKAVYRAMLAAAPRHHQAAHVPMTDVEKHHGIGGKPQQIAGLDKDAEIERLKDALTFVERWANHHAQKPHVTAAEALSCIQHYPEIEAITESYADGKVPETRDPYAEIAALQQEVDNALALWSVTHAERSEAMIHGARLDAEIIALKAERDALRKDTERLDWLDQNIFSRENINFMGQLDPTMNMWVTFSPKGHQGSARNILDAAMKESIQSAQSTGRFTA